MFADGRAGEPRLGWPAYFIAAILAVSILFGGGGAEGAFNNGVILAVSAILLCGLVAAHAIGVRPLSGSAVVPVFLILAFLLIGAFQLVPLQPEMWRTQPGRELAAPILQLVHAGNGSRPLSLDPEATRRAMAAMLLPAAMMIGVAGSTRREISLLLHVIIGCAVVSSAMGALQLALGYPAWLIYYEGIYSRAGSAVSAAGASGVFANVNHQAALLLTAIVCVGLAIRLGDSGVGPEQRRRKPSWAWLFIPVFIILTFATGSRAGLLLLLVAVPLSVIIGLGRTSPRLLLTIFVGVCLVAFLLSEITPAGNTMPIGQSFLFSNDKRYAILPDVLLTLSQFWPVGSGLGTFVQVFAVNENLDIAGTAFVNHAHNDLLELLIESGVAGLLWVIVAAVAILVRVALVQVRDRSGQTGRGAMVWGGFSILALLGLHSLVDFPLRTEALAGVAGVAFGLVFMPAKDERPVPRGRGPALAGFTAAAVIAALIGGEVFRIYAAQADVRAGHGAAAVGLDPWNGEGLALAGEERLLARDYANARALASEAILRSPLSVRAVRVIALVDDLQHRNGIMAWRLASALGWRDPATQFWAMRQALANREYATAAIRADALLRTSRDPGGQRIAAVRALSTLAPFRAELIQRLLLEPRWASDFFTLPATASDQQLQGASSTLTDLVRAGTRVTPREARITIQMLIDRGQYSSAIALDRLVSGRSANGSDHPLDFDQDTDHYAFDVTPFDWNVLDGSGTVTSVEQSGSRRVLVLGTDGRHRYQPVRRDLALAPGGYRLGFTMAGASDSPAALGLAVYCAGSTVPLATSSSEPLQRSDFVERELRFSVSSACPLVLIAFEAKQAEAPAEARFADLSLTRI